MRSTLLLIWIGTFLISVLVLLSVNVQQAIPGSLLVEGLISLSKLYSPILVILLAYYWQTRKKKDKKYSETAIVLAVICSSLWNLLILFFIVPLAFRPEEYRVNLEYGTEMGESFYWLVGGCIGYFFGTEK